MKNKLLGASFGLAIMALGMTSVNAAPVIYFGENLAPGGSVSGAPLTARTSFLAGLSGGVGTEDFEGSGGSTPPVALSFPGSSGGITATLNAPTGGVCGSGTVGSITCGLGRYATSGANYFQTTSNGYTISFDTPIAAFGFYGTDIGDINGQLTVQLDAGPAITVGHTLNSPDGSLMFWGFIDTMATYSTITFGTTSQTDVFGFDDMTIGDANQVVIGVPEPGMLAILGLGLAGIGFARRKRMI